MTEVTGHCIAPPLLKLAAENGRMIPVTVDEEKCNWNLIGKSVVEGKRIDRWGVIDFSSELDLEEFVLRLTNMCKSLGIHMEEPLRRHSTMSTLSSVPNLRALLESLNKEAFDSKKLGGNLQFILCVMSRKDRGYKQLKWISETQVGIVTQCCLSTRANEANASFLTNLAFKINAKLGGSNVELHDPFLEFEGKGCVLFLGADVNHPTDDTSPSIAAVVATTNWPAANRYAARVRMQEHRTERILHFGDMSLELLQHYAQLNNVWPDKIVVFRDGVGDSNFYMVLNEELSDLRRAFKTVNYNPAITLIVVHKRHSTRFFLEDGFGNVSPGTVVDKKIVHPFEFDFYLCSHYGCFGTSKAPHYYVLLNENEFSSDLLQRVIYYLCFTYACGTRPVSLVPPVYYADHVAYRGRLYYEAMEEGQSPASKAPSSSSSHSSYQNFFKLHADLENEMFFV
jgi:eukaryotic translation initiation factor 2C